MVDRASTPGPPRSASRSRSSTTSSTSRAPRPTLGKTLGQGRRRRQADLPGAVRPGAVARRWPPTRVARADAALARAGLADGHLPAIARWIVERRIADRSHADEAAPRSAAGAARPGRVARARPGADPRRAGRPRGPGRGQGRHHGVRARRGPRHRPGPPWVEPRRREAGARARHLRRSTSPGGWRSTSAPRPAASPTCCSPAARGGSIAVDVGRGQLHWKLRTDPRVAVVEGVNARHLTAADLPGLDGPPGIVTIDVSFISLALILPPLLPLRDRRTDVVALVKPQFEAGRRDAPKGVVRDPAVHARVVAELTVKAAAIGWARLAVTPSPIVGGKGNREFLMHLRRTRPRRRRARRPMRIGIVTKHDLVEARETLADLERVAARRAASRRCGRRRPRRCCRRRRRGSCARDALAGEVDLVVVLGGDGTLLATAGASPAAAATCRSSRQLRQPRLPHRDHPARAADARSAEVLDGRSHARRAHDAGGAGPAGRRRPRPRRRC